MLISMGNTCLEMEAVHAPIEGEVGSSSVGEGHSVEGVEFTDLINSSISFNSEGGGIHALNT